MKAYQLSPAARQDPFCVGQGTLVFSRVPLVMLQPGVVLSHAVYGDGDIKLLSAGVPVTEPMLRAIRARGTDLVMMEKSDQLKFNVRSSDGSPSLCVFACDRCRTPLPLKLADGLATWICAKCHTAYHGHLDLDAASQFLDNVLIKKLDIDRSRLQPPPEDVARVVNELVPTPYAGPERRASTRMAITIPVAVVPVDEDYEPVGPPFMMTTRNISTGGIAMIHNEPIRTTLLVVELPAKHGAPTQLVLQVLRCRPLGSAYEVAGKFLMRAAD